MSVSSELPPRRRNVNKSLDIFFIALPKCWVYRFIVFKMQVMQISNPKQIQHGLFWDSYDAKTLQESQLGPL